MASAASDPLMVCIIRRSVWLALSLDFHKGVDYLGIVTPSNLPSLRARLEGDLVDGLGELAMQFDSGSKKQSKNKAISADSERLEIDPPSSYQGPTGLDAYEPGYDTSHMAPDFTDYGMAHMASDFGYNDHGSINQTYVTKPAYEPIVGAPAEAQGGAEYYNLQLSSASYSNQPALAAKTKEYTCLHDGCGQKPFKRSADLDRHLKQVHLPKSMKERYSCDYPRCSRKGDVVGADTGAFHRKDHFRDHLRDFHKEDLLKRGTRDHGAWLADRHVDSKWWRCSKCLGRVRISAHDWKCPGCKVSCEQERRVERAQRSERAARQRA